ncbi:MAG: hypothetical protein AB7P99_19140 [Vicinamibacterales bacterium]
MALPDAAPYLSIVLTGRNDGYGVDFNDRLFRTLAFNHRELDARGISHEFVFVEWAPVAGAPTLFEVVRDAVPSLRRDAVRWLLVDAAFQDALSLNPRLKYLEYVAKNVGIRRAAGRFVLASNCDIYLGRRVLDVLQEQALSPRCVYRAARHDLKLSIDQSHLDWAALEDPRNLDGPPRQLTLPYMAGGTGDFLLLDRATFHELRGFNEIYRLVRAGIDRNFVVKALSSGVPLADIGGPVYHVNHVGTFRVASRSSAHAVGNATSAGERWSPNAVAYQNPASWGLGEARDEPLADGCRRLRFSWDAVPPLVDLRGIVLPLVRPDRVPPDAVGESNGGPDAAATT